MRIKTVRAQQILDCRRKPTIRIFVNGCSGAAPSGTSKSKFEVLDFGMPVGEVVSYINSKLSKKLIGLKIECFEDLHILDSIYLKILGGNPRIALEFAILNALAKEQNKALWQVINPKANTMPRLLANIVGGGAHAPKSNFDIQEVLISPREKSFKEDFKLARQIYFSIGRLSTKKRTVENAWIFNKPAHKVLELVAKNLPADVELGCDFAASNIWAHNKYHWHDIGELGTREHFKYISQLAYEFGLFYLEDPFQQAAFGDFAKLLKELRFALVCGDDLIATNLARLKQAVDKKAINAVIIKPNQIGSLIKAKEVLDYACAHGITPIISHRSGETLDTTIADLAFAWQVPFVKFGIGGKERLVKLQRLLKIEESIA
ncbi:MAG: hypothetical protein ACP5IJ_00555 [Candidatus Nanoarchaeia archaeon]